MTPIRIGGWFQGPTGSGQGGWTAHRFLGRVSNVTAAPLTASIRAPIPLDTDLVVVDRSTDGRFEHHLLDPNGDTIMIAREWAPAFADTDAVSIDEAATARGRFGETVDDHPVPSCFSCGELPDSMGVHAGPLDDGRFATDWRVPAWAVGQDGSVDTGVLWAALDCCAAWWVSRSGERRAALTVQYAVEEIEPLAPGTPYALVAWAGDGGGDWDGRKRRAASAAFDVDGRCVARASSLWVSIA